ncbi:hypothetical protein [Gordonia sp. 4N]|uniref:hypothetical protein n=1 Tax=Gordonia sp. 4N TaxID=2993508 RepID=UPI002248F0F4|nr:hypothetical protein [Gordonia sp. 4N]MCX2753073.1 hypothetical protein [Gordonia sp. 4N]
MAFKDLAQIEIVAERDRVVVSGGGPSDWQYIRLDRSPEGIFSADLTLITIESDFAPGGRAGGEDVPIREMVLPFNLYAPDGGRIEETVSRFRKLFWKKRFQWRYTSSESGMRWLNARLSKGIKVAPKEDWNLHGYARAEVYAVALQPMYESAPLKVKAANPSAGSHTAWLPAWNPTDQRCYLEFDLDPKTGASFQIPDFSFGNEHEHDLDWTVGQHANRMVAIPTITKKWSVMADPVMDTYVAEDLSNAAGVMGGVEPLYWLPEYTGSELDPIMLPVVINGAAGAEVKMTLRRLWSAESGLE